VTLTADITRPAARCVARATARGNSGISCGHVVRLRLRWCRRRQPRRCASRLVTQHRSSVPLRDLSRNQHRLPTHHHLRTCNLDDITEGERDEL